MPDVDVRLLAIGVGGVLALLLAGWLVKRFFFTAPQIDAVQPAQAEMGQEIMITGTRFRGDAADNKVWFGTVPATASRRDGHTACTCGSPSSRRRARWPSRSRPRAAARRPVSLAALAPLRATALDPPGRPARGRGGAERERLRRGR